jgi:hypothetical protein
MMARIAPAVEPLFPGEDLCVSLTVSNGTGSILEIFDPSDMLSVELDVYRRRNGVFLPLDVDRNSPEGAPYRTLWIGVGQKVRKDVCWSEAHPDRGVSTWYQGEYQVFIRTLRARADFTVASPVLHMVATIPMGFRVVSDKQQSAFPASRSAAVLEFNSAKDVVVSLRDETAQGSRFFVRAGERIQEAGDVTPPIPYRRIAVAESDTVGLAFSGDPEKDLRLTWAPGRDSHSIQVPRSGRQDPVPGTRLFKE